MSTVADKRVQIRRQDSVKQAKDAEAAQLRKAQKEEVSSKQLMESKIWLWNLLDLDQTFNIVLLVVLRLVQACTMTWNEMHPDQHWQATQVAYKWVYGGDIWLPWEWLPEYQLRNTVYPAYLALPLYALKQTGLDSQMAVLIQPYLTHSLLVICGDLALWKVGKKYIGANATRVALLLCLTCRIQQNFIAGCFTNGVEQILSVVAFYYYLEQKNRFTWNTVMLTTTITVSFIIRNTSPIGWVPLLAIKVLFEGALVPFLIAGIFVAVPTIGALISVDTLYFLGVVDGENWVVTSYNFMQRNILEGLSKYFGEDPPYWYAVEAAPQIFMLMYPLVIWANGNHFFTKRNRGESPYLTYYNVFYFVVFSLIPHKEMRFLIPMVPFAFIMTGELIAQAIKRGSCFVPFLVKVFVVVETFLIFFMRTYDNAFWQPDHYLASKGEPIHSVYFIYTFGAPHYSYFHGMDTKLYLEDGNPIFVKYQDAKGDFIERPSLGELYRCEPLIKAVEMGKMLPQYVLIKERAYDEGIYFQICKDNFESLSRDGRPLYTFEKLFEGDLIHYEPLTDTYRYNIKLYLYRLDSQQMPF